MTVSRLSTLKEFGIFRDFTWPNDLSEFGKYNLIYGWNGSGKTTLSRLFRAMELSQTPGMGTVIVKVDDSSVAGSDFPNSTFPIRVFNTDFVRASVFPTGGEVAPIFIIGESSVEKQKEVERLKSEKARDIDNLKASQRKLKQSADALDKFCVEKAKNIKEQLRSSDHNLYNNYDKSRFATDIQAIIKANSADSLTLTHADLSAQLKQTRATSKPILDKIAYRQPDFEALERATAELLGSTVVNTAIESLKDDSQLSEWTRSGLTLHQDRQSPDCLFCGQGLPAGLIKRLEGHFSTEFEELQTRIDAQLRTIGNLVSSVQSIQKPKPVELYDDLADAYTAATSELDVQIRDCGHRLVSLREQVSAKKAKPFTSIELEGKAPDIEPGRVEAVNELLERHNSTTIDFQEKVKKSRQKVAEHYLAECVAEYLRLKKEAEQATVDKSDIESRIQAADQKIAGFERDIVEHRQPAEELNGDLKKYLGHDELQLLVSETGYSVTRNGERARFLSEGEMTAIALLYFLKSLGDRNFDKSKGLVVLDDPVSSLDANAMYLAFGLIRERTADVAQVLVLTHNFPFFRQVRNWLKQTSGHRFYMLQCSVKDGQRCSEIRKLDALLANFESEYHFLYSCLSKAAKEEDPEDFEEYYHFPNIARRTLENFLAFRHPRAHDSLWRALKEIKTSDEARKARILNFVQTHSHGPSVGQPEHDPFILGECQSIIRDLLDLIKDEDHQHFEAMEKLVTNP